MKNVKRRNGNTYYETPCMSGLYKLIVLNKDTMNANICVKQRHHECKHLC